MIYHGGKSLFGNTYESTCAANYMHQSALPYKSSLYGRGFSLYCRLADNPSVCDDVQNKIADRYFDYILYGSVFRDPSYWDLVKKTYIPSKVIFIDGEDHHGIITRILGLGHYFKRELVEQETTFLHSIGFGIPKELIRTGTKKTKDFAHIDPADRSTYIYTTEDEYYKDYAESYFAWTQKKAGWDCLRHYEILANGCMPAFRDIDNCPANTLKHFPKDILLNYYKSHGYEFSNDYWSTMDQIVNHCYEHCTTEAIFKSILERIV